MNTETQCAVCGHPGPLTSVMVCRDCEPKLAAGAGAQARLAALLDHLSEIEFIEGNAGIYYCPACNHSDLRGPRHEPNCWLAAALAEGKETTK